MMIRYFVRIYTKFLMWILSTRVGRVLLGLLMFELLLYRLLGEYAALVNLFLLLTVPLALLAYFRQSGYSLGNIRSPSTGHSRYEVGSFDLAGLLDPNGGDVPTDDIMKRDTDVPPKPTFEDETGTMVLGDTGTGKSTFVKSRLQEWDDDAAIIAHALNEQGGYNELAEFFRAQGHDVEIVSSQNSTVRWDPFLDLNHSVSAMQELRAGIFQSSESKETGLHNNARMMLTAALMITAKKDGDFAALPEHLGRGSQYIVDEFKPMPDPGNISRSLEEASDVRSDIYSILNSEINDLLATDLFDESIERISLREYLDQPDGTTIVLDNYKNRSAQAFWRFLLQTSIEWSMNSVNRQQFVLDEFTKLPRIDNLVDLASAGRSADSIGMFVAQDVGQIEAVYEEEYRSIWRNSPNRVCFRTGAKTAEMALDELGERLIENRSVSQAQWLGFGSKQKQVNRSLEEGRPLLTSDLTELERGEAFIHTPKGWWLADLTEPNLDPMDPHGRQQTAPNTP